MARSAKSSAKGLVSRISGGAGFVITKVITQNNGILVGEYINRIKRNADAVRNKGFAKKGKK